MEGTHTTLQLHKPITELCYVSFYLPGGKVRGFTYKGCVTLDRSSKRFCSCYQVRETLEMELKELEDFGDIILKKTTTKDILIELYKLMAEKEKLLSSLLRSHHILGLSTRHQEGKQQGFSVVPKLKGDNYSSFSHQQEFFLDSTVRNHLNNKKMRKYKQKESSEEFRHWKGGKRKYGCLSLLNAQDMQLENKKILPRKFPTRSFPSNFSASSWLTINGKDDLPGHNCIQPERWIEEGCSLKSKEAGKLNELADLQSSSSKDNIDMVAVQLENNGEPIPEVMKVQQSITLIKSSQDKPEKLGKFAVAKSLQSSKYAEPICKEKAGITAVAEVQDSETCIKIVANPSAESLPDFYRTKEAISPVPTIHKEFLSRTDAYSPDEAARDARNTELQEKEQGGSGLQYKAERVHITDESCNLVGAVNKALLKVKRSDSLDEAAEWKRLQQITRVDRNLPGAICEKRPTVSQGSSKHLFLNLLVNESPDISQTSSNFKLEEKRLHSPTLVAVSNVFSNSYPLSNTHKQMSPIPSPLSSRLPSPQLHHRILPLPTQNAEDKSMFSDYGSGKHSAINLSFSDLEPQFYLKFPEPGEFGLATRQPGPHQNATAGHFDKHAAQEKSTTQTQQSFCP
ncbi:FMN1 protein, partial [Turnix velox]|nr:FMN1 protein [Turnix velox]